jgi:hypothetical protein
MGRIALVTVVLAGLTASAAVAAQHPRWTAKGKITKLTSRTITVHGKSCRITADSPKPLLRIYVVGSTVKIVCGDGQLVTIDRLSTTTNGAPGQSSSSSSVSGSSSASSSTSSGSSSSSASALALAGEFSVTAVGNGSITVRGGSSSYTCKIGTGSPDVSGFHVGARVSKMTCKDDVLTMIAG